LYVTPPPEIEAEAVPLLAPVAVILVPVAVTVQEFR
jgi:hypothetical protein